MAEVILKNDNVDNITKLWLPDKELCTAQDELRRIEEWKRKSGGVKRPSELGIDSYRYGKVLHKKFYEGRYPPPVPLDSAENLEWYEEQLKRCIFGFEYDGVRITGDHYWMLNFVPFMVAKKGADGEVTPDFEINFPYFSYQHDYIFKLIEEAHSLGKGFMMMGGRGFGKQQPDSEPVMTPEGPVPIGAIRPGDYVLGKDGAPTKVLQIHPQGVDDVYQITLKDGRKIRCGLEHLWTVYDKRGKIRTVELSEMLHTYKKVYDNGDTYYSYFVPTAGAAQYSEKELPVNPYTLGALLGDGSFDRYGVRLASAKKDSEIIKKILKVEGWTESDVSVYDEKIAGYESIDRFYFKKSTGLLKRIEPLGLRGVSTMDKFIPKLYLMGSIEQRMELLKGLMDTDGYISKNGKIEFTNTSKYLVSDVITLVRSLGMKAVLGYDRRTDNVVYRVRIYTNNIIFNLSRKVKRARRKAARMNSFINKTPIVNIEKLPCREHSTCITVDAKDSLYLTTDYTVTHNTYTILSVIAKTYFLKPESINYISATHSGHADEAFSKIKRILAAIEKAHPTLKLARLINTKSHVKSGYEVTKDGIKTEEGPMSEIQKIIYGDNPGVTKGSRPDTQLLEEIGDWSSGKGNLKACYAASEGSWRVGSIYKCRVFMIGTGGSVSTDQANDMFLNPDAYNILAVKDFIKTTGKKHAVFIPSHYLYGGAGWERTGVNNNGWAKKHLETERELKKEDAELLTRFVQEYPFTIEEVFRKTGTNIFHQRNIAKQWTDLQFGTGNTIKPEVGFLEWKRSKSGKILGVEWVVNPNGNIEIVEHPYKGKDGKTKFNDLYVAGIDSVDQGQLDSTTSKNRSSLAMLVKKRMVDGEYFSQTSNIYVAKYIGRSLDVRDDYEESLKLALYYNAKVNIEYTRIGIIHYYREKKQWKLFMKRPAIARSNAGSADLEYIKRLREQTLIGTTTTPVVIDHQDGKIKEYTRDFCHQIYFTDLLEQLRDYQREDRTKYDLVVAMGLCEIADEDLMSIPAKESNLPSKELKKFGYYIDHRGVKRFGELPESGNIRNHIKTNTPYDVRWIDMDGNDRFDERFGDQLDEIET